MPVRLATRDDNPRLLELTRHTPMPGVISLRIDREPDFFRLADLRGGGAVLVAEEDERLVGCISLTSRLSYIGGEPRTLWYIGDLKVHPDYRGRGVGVALGGAAQDLLTVRDADLLFCVVSAGNRRALSFLEGRFNFPAFHYLGRFHVGQYLSFRYKNRGPYTVTVATCDDIPAVSRLYHHHARKHELAPVLEESDWDTAISATDGHEQVLVARHRGTVCGLATVFDATPVKQHVVMGIPRHIRLVAAPLRPLGRFSPAFRLPRPGQTAHMLYVRHLCLAAGHEAASPSLLRTACREAHSRGYPLVVIGPHDRDPIRAMISRYPHFTMGSDGYLTSLKGNTDLVQRVANGIPVEDYALV